MALALRCVTLVLAGGHGERLGAGVPKAAAVVAGRALVLRAFDAVAAFSERLVCVAPAALELPGMPGVVRVHDPGEGPLGAIAAAAAVCGTQRVLVMSADQPFLDAAFLVALVRAGDGAPAVVATTSGVLQPLPVWLDASGLAAVVTQHAAGERSLARALRAAAAHECAAEALPGGVAALRDIDTPADRAAAELELRRASTGAVS